MDAEIQVAARRGWSRGYMHADAAVGAPPEQANSWRAASPSTTTAVQLDGGVTEPQRWLPGFLLGAISSFFSLFSWALPAKEKKIRGRSRFFFLGFQRKGICGFVPNDHFHFLSSVS
uniref:Uncharacterized protein n=1 Tax=Setaria viridis TaxID=4556 RepID=A0A4U6U3N6_SETVI|nr:hypothetical protein SEVIR_6G141901v2 [Setaria viridis]